MTVLISFDVGIKNLAVCVFKISSGCSMFVKNEDNDKTIVLWELLCTSGSIESILSNLDTVDFFFDMDDDQYTLIIERQPSCNPKMRVVASVIETYVHMTKPDYVKLKVRKPSAMDKWRKSPCWGDANLKFYSGRKKLSVSLCDELVSSMSVTWKTHYDSYKKKDDLADSFLQGFFFDVK